MWNDIPELILLTNWYDFSDYLPFFLISNVINYVCSENSEWYFISERSSMTVEFLFYEYYEMSLSHHFSQTNGRGKSLRGYNIKQRGESFEIDLYAVNSVVGIMRPGWNNSSRWGMCIFLGSKV